jgi:glycosyltransferase involved in cell wall biosynthesis
MSTVSLCLIVKNEEIMLERCLASIVAIADEIIIVDTGSTDRTIEIAQKFVSKVHHFAWIDDFAAARNYAQSLATCEYVCRWDADCTLRDGDISKLLAIKNNNFDNADLYNLNYVEHFEISTDGSIKPAFQESLFFFYRRNMFHWESPIHNQLVINNSTIKPKIRSDNQIYVLHHREESGKLWRKKQTLEILKSRVDKNGSDYQRMLYFYARELYFDTQYDESIIQFQKILRLNIQNHLRDYAIEKIFFALFYSNQYNRINKFQNLIHGKLSPCITLLKADLLCLSDPIGASVEYQNYINSPFLAKDCQYEYDIERYQVHPYIQLAKIQIYNQDPDNARINLNKIIPECVSQESKTRVQELLKFC